MSALRGSPWVIPILQDGTGSSNVVVTVKGVGSSGRVSCRGVTYNGAGQDVSSNPFISNARVDSSIEQIKFTIPVPPFGAYYAYCFMDSQTRILSVHY